MTAIPIIKDVNTTHFILILLPVPRVKIAESIRAAVKENKPILHKLPHGIRGTEVKS